VSSAAQTGARGDASRLARGDPPMRYAGTASVAGPMKPRIGAISSAEEHCLHTAGVTGSSPVSPTTVTPAPRLRALPREGSSRSWDSCPARRRPALPGQPGRRGLAHEESGLRPGRWGHTPAVRSGRGCRQSSLASAARALRRSRSPLSCLARSARSMTKGLPPKWTGRSAPRSSTAGPSPATGQSKCLASLTPPR
jgi:hypothetical protein